MGLSKQRGGCGQGRERKQPCVIIPPFNLTHDKTWNHPMHSESASMQRKQKKYFRVANLLIVERGWYNSLGNSSELWAWDLTPNLAWPASRWGIAHRNCTKKGKFIEINTCQDLKICTDSFNALGSRFVYWLISFLIFHEITMWPENTVSPPKHLGQHMQWQDAVPELRVPVVWKERESWHDHSSFNWVVIRDFLKTHPWSCVLSSSTNNDIWKNFLFDLNASGDRSWPWPHTVQTVGCSIRWRIGPKTVWTSAILLCRFRHHSIRTWLMREPCHTQRALKCVWQCASQNITHAGAREWLWLDCSINWQSAAKMHRCLPFDDIVQVTSAPRLVQQAGVSSFGLCLVFQQAGFSP